MTNKKIAIIYTTFLRDELMKQTVNSILKNCGDDFLLFVGDQQPSRDKEMWLRLNRAIYLPLNFDSGVSNARNVLIEYAKIYDLKFCILSADSIAFTPDTVSKIDKAMQFLENNQEVGILGFELNSRIPWEYFMDLKDGRFILTKNEALLTDEQTGLKFKSCDICRQFFLAKTDTLLQTKWDEQFKTGEHEDFFWRYKLAGHKVCWTPDIIGEYIDCKPPEYLKYRNRQYQQFREMLFKKYNLSDWVEYR